ncbi:MAG: shikimate kinase [Candidatus Margulisbacteria bacterium]|nr:shikimate kinase [Candidatus Margulisiibacteriota bacterium]
MGSGKTSVANELHTLSKYPIIETDQIIEDRVGMSIPDIFKTKGEPFFREQEAEVCCSLSTIRTPSIISTGGGLIMDKTNQACLKKLGTIFYLYAKQRTILDRIQKEGGRPLLDNASNKQTTIQSLFSTRHPVYQSIADVTIFTDRLDPKQVASHIFEQFQVTSPFILGNI